VIDKRYEMESTRNSTKLKKEDFEAETGAKQRNP
jgi:hypothetical protein